MPDAYILMVIQAMNLRLGLVRAWIVLSAIWLVAMASNTFPSDVNLRDWWTLIWLFAIPPIGFAILLAALGWVIAGFREPQ
jgi:hypothetical protein